MSYFDDFGGSPGQSSWRFDWKPLYLIFSLESFSLGLWILIDPEEICIEFGFAFLTVGLIFTFKGDGNDE